MRWIIYLFLFLALLVLAGFLLPREVTLERSAYVTRPPQAVFPYANDLRKFNLWSPWYQLDPAARYQFSGPRTGVGASMTWHSDNPNVGNGAQTITASEPPSLVRTQLDFGKQGRALSEMQLRPQGSGTNVTWRFSTDMGAGPVARWMGLLVKKMVGQSYERGLAKLKDVVEASEPPTPREQAPADDMDSGSGDSQPLEGEDDLDGQPDTMDPGIQTPPPQAEPAEPDENSP
ncbi:SRPBCC family protein [Microbulbifer sp. SAOS-129_SWC]|uniref:SRPBCC family protein n=1 Tax=Microbulbifer sp. SAOS-129_SWC TaxID=3145235 RepID=UPI003217CD49